MIDIDKELDIHVHVIHDSSTDQWTYVAECGNKACCITSAYNDSIDPEGVSRYVSEWLSEWVKKIGIEQLNKRRMYLSAQLKEIDERISEVSE